MKNTRWVLIDTETTGLSSPIFAVELAAQRMLGWKPEGEPFRALLDHKVEIPTAASRVHGYTREILQRDGVEPLEAHRRFNKYIETLPIVAFNLSYDLEQVLKPEWKRLGFTASGKPGFCALRLAQRLLDPVPAGNCKLQTLRQYYNLPDRGEHSALGDVQTVADLCERVLHPLAEYRGLDTWWKLASYAADEWYPSRIAFGKYKGRLIHEARSDGVFRGWLEWLTESSNERTANMGRWYLRRIEEDGELLLPGSIITTVEKCREDLGDGAADARVVIYSNLELDRLKNLVAVARTKLAELETSYTKEKSKVDATNSRLFGLLRAHYQRRDRLRLIVDYREKYLHSLVRGEAAEAAQAEKDFAKAKEESDSDYDITAEMASKKRVLTPDEQGELSVLWRKLVKLYHPDRFVNEPEKHQTYVKLTTAINLAKDNGNIATLREIAEDPQRFIIRQGWAILDFSDEAQLDQLRKLYDALQLEIVTVIESLYLLRESPEYELKELTEKNPELLEKVAAERAIAIEKEIEELAKLATKLAGEIRELDEDADTRIS
jgi:DNA polymerase III epsilon subunit-like protein